MIALLVDPRLLTNPPRVSSMILGRISDRRLQRIYERILYEKLYKLILRKSKGYLTGFLYGKRHKCMIEVFDMLSSQKRILDKLNHFPFNN